MELGGTISGVIAAWLVFEFLESKGSAGSSRAGEEIREVTGERDDLNNPADKLPEENDNERRIGPKNRKRGVFKKRFGGLYVNTMQPAEMEEFWCNALFGALLGMIVTILFLKLWKSKERMAERGRRRLSGCNNPPGKQPVENDERRTKTPQEHEQRLNTTLLNRKFKYIPSHGIFQKVMEKVMESHGILTGQKCTNPDYGTMDFTYSSLKELHELVGLHHDVQLLGLDLHVKRFVGERLLPLLEKMDPLDSEFLRLYRVVHGLLCGGDKVFPAVVLDNI
ncbi:hypothetical protein AWC38_SpisGene4602 [Stylophora pistillata]|uniref:Uncharacterized protein n=1 Tax=Stylophora pistillata TaxID=50429 RepID=A0A2B4SIY1_STYPI|nr:hypothetical protein AWC38_SpisGene4602 [Stylophora pistillata]